MRTICVIKTYCGSNVAIAIDGEHTSVELEVVKDAFSKIWNSYPKSVLGLNYAESHVNLKNQLVVCYTDLPFEKVRQINRDFERVFFPFPSIMEQTFLKKGLSNEEFADVVWDSVLNRRESKQLVEAFGQWQMSICPFYYLNENLQIDEKKVRNDYLDWFWIEHVVVLDKIHDFVLSHIEVDSLDKLCVHLNRFSKFPSTYFRKTCQVHGWQMNGLDFGEMCTDGQRILSMGSNGKCVLG